jgi:hypothetical protein
LCVDSLVEFLKGISVGGEWMEWVQFNPILDHRNLQKMLLLSAKGALPDEG